MADFLWMRVLIGFLDYLVVASFGIAYFMARQYKVDGVFAGVLSQSSFLLQLPFSRGDSGEQEPTFFTWHQGLYLLL